MRTCFLPHKPAIIPIIYLLEETFRSSHFLVFQLRSSRDMAVGGRENTPTTKALDSTPKLRPAFRKNRCPLRMLSSLTTGSGPHSTASKGTQRLAFKVISMSMMPVRLPEAQSHTSCSKRMPSTKYHGQEVKVFALQSTRNLFNPQNLCKNLGLETSVGEKQADPWGAGPVSLFPWASSSHRKTLSQKQGGQCLRINT